MKHFKKSALCIVIAAVMILSPAAFATGGTANDMQGFSLSGESLDICGLALRPNGEASTIYENAGMKLLVPLEFDNLLIVDTPQDNTVLFTVCEKASVEADMAQGDSGDGAGWLFSIGALSEIQLYELLCYDMSGIEIFARDAEGIYYAYYHPTDVRFVRESYEGIGDGSNEGWKQWSALNEWAWGNVRKTFIAENDGLSAETYNNSELGIFLARAAFTDDLPYTVSTTEYGPMTPNGVYAEPYVMRLLRNTHVEFVNDTEAPDGEYVVLSFPDDDYRFDFFLAEGSENIYRQIWNGNEELFRISFPDGTTKASEVMQKWYQALAAADSMRELGYKPDDLIGRWAEKIAGRGLITITQGAKGMYDVIVEWSNSAAEKYIWEMTARPTGAGGVLRYEYGRHLIRTFTSDTEYTDDVRYENGTGELYLNSAYELMWEDDVDGAGDNTVFVNAG